MPWWRRARRIDVVEDDLDTVADDQRMAEDALSDLAERVEAIETTLARPKRPRPPGPQLPPPRGQKGRP